jgi:pimeloyl-ACP methyl ester carboxylesterase
VSAIDVAPVGRMEPGRQPPGSVAPDEHEQGELVERVSSSRLLLGVLIKREPPHVDDRDVVGDEPGMLDLVSRTTALLSGPSFPRRREHPRMDRVDLVVAVDDRPEGTPPQDILREGSVENVGVGSVNGRLQASDEFFRRFRILIQRQHRSVHDPPPCFRPPSAPPRVRSRYRARAFVGASLGGMISYLPTALEVLGLEGRHVKEITAFVFPRLFALFGLPSEHSGGGTVPVDLVRVINIPTLVIAGGASPDFFRDTATRIADLLPDSEYTVLDGADHGAPADVVAPAVAEFLATARQAFAVPGACTGRALSGEISVLGNKLARDERRALRIVDDGHPDPRSVEWLGNHRAT